MEGLSRFFVNSLKSSVFKPCLLFLMAKYLIKRVLVVLAGSAVTFLAVISFAGPIFEEDFTLTLFGHSEGPEEIVEGELICDCRSHLTTKKIIKHGERRALERNGKLCSMIKKYLQNQRRPVCDEGTCELSLLARRQKDFASIKRSFEIVHSPIKVMPTKSRLDVYIHEFSPYPFTINRIYDLDDEFCQFDGVFNGAEKISSLVSYYRDRSTRTSTITLFGYEPFRKIAEYIGHDREILSNGWEPIPYQGQ